MEYLEMIRKILNLSIIKPENLIMDNYLKKQLKIPMFLHSIYIAFTVYETLQIASQM